MSDSNHNPKNSINKIGSIQRRSDRCKIESMLVGPIGHIECDYTPLDIFLVDEKG